MTGESRPGWHPASRYIRVYVLRLGHRPYRDKRVTSHAALVARAFGANGFILEGTCDESVERTILRVNRCWGGNIAYACGVNGIEYIDAWKRGGGEVIHLTMYGIPFYEVIDSIRSSSKPKLIVIGAEKVGREYYELSDYNVSIGLQPHSEVAALAIFLDRLYRGSWTNIIFHGAKLKIIPTERGKHVDKRGDEC